MPLECLCELCRFSEIDKVKVMVPKYKFSNDVKQVERLRIWCNQKSGYVGMLVTYHNHKCDYKPKAGKISKNAIQKTLF